MAGVRSILALGNLFPVSSPHSGAKWGGNVCNLHSKYCQQHLNIKRFPPMKPASGSFVEKHADYKELTSTLPIYVSTRLSPDIPSHLLCREREIICPCSSYLMGWNSTKISYWSNKRFTVQNLTFINLLFEIVWKVGTSHLKFWTCCSI